MTIDWLHCCLAMCLVIGTILHFMFANSAYRQYLELKCENDRLRENKKP